MSLTLTQTLIGNILTRTTGYLTPIASHSLQPYRGCSFGRSLCGVGCYVRHNGHILKGREWGSFLEVRENAADSYREHYHAERRWGRKTHGEFGIFCSSSTDPFLPQERSLGVTARLLATMTELPPDQLILQTHSDQVADSLPLLEQLVRCCRVRVHVSIETDRDRLPGLPPPACSVARRMKACERLRSRGVRTIVTVAPLLPIRDPRRFFQQLGNVADAVVIDHFIGGDGSPDGSRTRRTSLPAAMSTVHPGSELQTYRDEIVRIACEVLPGRVGVGPDGFAGKLLHPFTPRD